MFRTVAKIANIPGKNNKKAPLPWDGGGAWRYGDDIIISR